MAAKPDERDSLGEFVVEVDADGRPWLPASHLTRVLGDLQTAIDALNRAHATLTTNTKPRRPWWHRFTRRKLK